MTDPFNDINAQLEETEGLDEGDKETQHHQDAKDDEQPQEPSNHDEDTKVAEDAKQDQQNEEDKHGPPFSFEQSKQGPIYPRAERWDEWNDAKWEIQAYLREHGLKDTEGREVDDALLRLAIENPEEIGDIVLEARGLDND